MPLTTEYEICPQCKNQLPSANDKCNFCGYEFSQENSKSALSKTIIINVLIVMLIGGAIAYFTQNPELANFFSISTEGQTAFTIIGFIFPLVIFVIIIAIIAKLKKHIPEANNFQKNLIATKTKAEKYTCKTCNFSGPYEQFVGSGINRFFFSCPNCRQGDKIYATLANGQEIKISPITTSLMILIIILMILISIIFDLAS